MTAKLISTEAVRTHRARLRAELGDEKYRRYMADQQAEYRRKHPHVRLQSNHRLSVTQAKFIYEAMQTASCEICGGEKVLFDHNHKTNKFRGFLCYACNSGLGQFDDNPELLEKAIKYLRDRS